MDQVWLSAPAPAMKVWRESGAPRWLANRALADAGAAGGLHTQEQWRPLVEALLTVCEQAAAPELPIGGIVHRATAVPLPPGWLVWLEAVLPPVQRPANAHISPHSAFNAALPQWISMSGVSVWRLDLATQRIQLNDVGYEAVGVEPRPDGVDIEQFRAVIHPDDLEAVARAAREAAESDRIIDLITRYRTRGGSYRHWITRRVAERDAQGRVVALAGVSIDQTDRIMERQRAQALAQRISFITEAAGVGVWRVDLRDGTFEWNEQMYRIYGIPPEAGPPSLERFIDEIVHPQDRETVRIRSDRGRGAAGPSQLEFRIRRPDGSERWLSSWLRRERIDDRPVDIGVTIDITERHLAAVQLREANERALLAAESAGIGTWERDLTRKMSIWNAQMYRLRGIEPVEGATPEALRTGSRHPDDGMSFDVRMQRALDEGTPFEEEMRVVWPDGSIHWIASRAIPQPGPSGRMERLLGVNWDITERKRAEQALREKAAAEQASRAKSEFLSRMSHELRTPLNAVIGFAQLLSQDAAEPLTARQSERVDRVHSAGLHLLALIDDVLDLATIESSSLSLASEAVSLKAAVDDALQWTQPQAARAGIALHAEPLDAWVQADGRRVRQILSNLLSNAVKYNRPGGEVRLGLAACAVQGRRGWQVCVRDTGRGMTPQQRAHLFEPFNRLGAERDGIEGTGIGLAIVRHLLGVMGGSIEVETTAGQGSEFRFILPAAQAQPQVPSAGAGGTPDDERCAAAPAGQGLRLLYIEDNAVNVLLVQELVAMRGNVQLLVAPNGETGVAMACAEQPDVVLIDMQLPDFDGFEVLRRLQAREDGRAGRAFIALSANAMPEDVDRARAAGFDDYWTKPIDFTQFLAKLDALALAE